MLFFNVVMKVLMFIELVSGVKYPKITTMVFVDVLWMFCRRAVLFCSFLKTFCDAFLCIYPPLGVEV